MESQSISVTKPTVPLLEERGASITGALYQYLFSQASHPKNAFKLTNQSKRGQSHASSDEVLSHARRMENLELLCPSVSRSDQKPVSSGVQLRNDKVIGDTLLAAIQHVLSPPEGQPALVR